MFALGAAEAELIVRLERDGSSSDHHPTLIL